MKILTRYPVIGCVALSKRINKSLRPFLKYILKNTFEISGKSSLSCQELNAKMKPVSLA